MAAEGQLKEHDGEEADICIKAAKLNINDNREKIYNDTHLLKCEETKNYVCRSKIMVIMKGLPGSGKSTIVRALSDAYPEYVICSADNYFERNKKYTYDKSQLSEAHMLCKQAAVASAESSVPLIIIDNTNIQNWEMRFYVNLADALNYVTVVMEPNTPWCRDAQVLEGKNSHGVTAGVLHKKIKCYEPVSPLYFGWFLNDADSHFILNTASSYLQKAMQNTEFKNHFSRCIGVESYEEIISHFSGGTYALQDTRLLHCTSCYTAKKEDEIVAKYMQDIGEWVGKIFPITIVAFIVTKNTFGARVALSNEQLLLYRFDDEDGNDDDASAGKKKKRFYPPQKAENEVKIPSYKPGLDDLKKRRSFKEEIQDIEELKNSPAGTKGSRAHITLGTAEGIPPVETGIELLALLSSKKKADTWYKMTDAILINHGNDVWGIYPKNKIIVDTMFAYHL